MKKSIGLALAVVMLTMALTACATKTAPQTVSTDGSTSMEKVIGALGESYMAKTAA